jgi:NADH dehydrogenase
MQFLHHSEANITLINRTNYFLFTPMLHEVATGGLAHHQVVESLRELTYKTHGEVFITDVHSIDLTNKIVHTHERDVSYDYLVVATGATTNFFGTKGAQEHSLVLKDLRDAIKIRNRLIDVFEQAAETDSVEERKKILTFAVVGGGATGVETVMEVADLFFNTFYRFYKGKIACEDVTLSLVNRDGEILKGKRI